MERGREGIEREVVKERDMVLLLETISEHNLSSLMDKTTDSYLGGLWFEAQVRQRRLSFHLEFDQ